jgi:uncharacterized protein YfkK (UPF0435 family)
MDHSRSLEYLVNEGLGKYINLNADETAVVNGEVQKVIPPNVEDLARIHQLIRSRKSFTVLEFGVGFSTIVIADALKKNKQDWETLENKPKIRNRFMFKCFSVDSSELWLNTAENRMHEDLKEFVNFHFSKVKIGTHNGQLCHFYENLPDIVADFIYLDGPDPKTVEGSINGLTFNCEERTVMAADLLLMEPTFLPGTFILLDGRTNNARFLKNNFKREYEFCWDKRGDITTFELVEERLGKYNLLGSDFFKEEVALTDTPKIPA